MYYHHYQSVLQWHSFQELSLWKSKLQMQETNLEIKSAGNTQHVKPHQWEVKYVEQMFQNQEPLSESRWRVFWPETLAVSLPTDAAWTAEYLRHLMFLFHGACCVLTVTNIRSSLKIDTHSIPINKAFKIHPHDFSIVLWQRNLPSYLLSHLSLWSLLSCRCPASFQLSGQNVLGNLASIYVANPSQTLAQ